MWLTWFYVSSSIPEQGSKILIFFHFFSLQSVAQTKPSHPKTAFLCIPLTAWLISFLSLDITLEEEGFFFLIVGVLIDVNIPWSQLSTKSLTLLFYALCLLLGSSSWNRTESKSLQANLNCVAPYYKGQLNSLSRNNKTSWISYCHHLQLKIIGQEPFTKLRAQQSY